MRRIEDVIVSRRPAQHVELDEPRDAGKVRVARQPDLLERILVTGNYLKSVHGDEHGGKLLRQLGRP
jgi:hypothetical protein